MERGDALEDLSFFDFVIGTYERNRRDMPAHPRTTVHVPYRTGYKPERHRVRRPPNHEQLPRVAGHWFPPNNEPARYEFYAACMLLLLKPWRSLDDLRSGFPDFASSLREFVAATNLRNIRIMDVIQAYHDCAREAHVQDPYAATATGVWEVSTGGDPNSVAEDDESEGPTLSEEVDRDIPGLPDPRTHLHNRPITETMIAQAAERSIQPHLRLFASEAVTIGENRGLFGPHPHQPGFDVAQRDPLAPTSVPRFTRQIEVWARSLRRSLRDDPAAFCYQGIDSLGTGAAPLHPVPPAVLPGSALSIGTGDPGSARNTGSTMTRPLYGQLNADQRRAHDCVVNHLLQRLNGVYCIFSGVSKTDFMSCVGHDVPQLLMLVLGEGGTGKSVVINAITESFAYYAQEHTLSKIAPTGVAATHIQGSTLHTWAGIPIAAANDDSWIGTTLSAQTKKAERRRVQILATEYLLLDEVSMVNKKHLHCLDAILRAERQRRHLPRADEAFGGINVVMFGDFHQFPPIGSGSIALYTPSSISDSQPYRLGKQLFDRFRTVVILREQMRSGDPVWTGLLHRLRTGDCTPGDLQTLRSLIIRTDPESPKNNERWDDAVLVTSRHAVRKGWNERALQRFSEKTGHLRYTFPAEDIDKATNEPPSPAIRLALASRARKDPQEHSGLKLESELTVVVGMRVMISFNIATENDIANGTRGVLVGLVLDERERSTVPDRGGVVRLRYPPAVLFVKLDSAPNSAPKQICPELAPGIIPLTPMRCSIEGTTWNLRQYHVSTSMRVSVI